MTRVSVGIIIAAVAIGISGTAWAAAGVRGFGYGVANVVSGAGAFGSGSTSGSTGASGVSVSATGYSGVSGVGGGPNGDAGYH